MITQTITDPYHFWLWVKQSNSYSNNFTQKGAYALQDYLEELSREIDEVIEFDPIAWCAEYSEYKDFDEFQHDTGYIQNGIEHKGYPDIDSLEELYNHTTVIEFNGGIIVQDF